MMIYKTEDITLACLSKVIFEMERLSNIGIRTYEEFFQYYNIKDENIKALICDNKSDVGQIVEFVGKNYFRHTFEIQSINPLRSSFDETMEYDPEVELYSEIINYPQKKHFVIRMAFLREVCASLRNAFLDETNSEQKIGRLFSILENKCSYISFDEDCSVYETAKILSGVSKCIYDYNIEHKKTDLSLSDRYILFCGLDFLGIKEFKFQDAYANSLRDVVSATLYIDLFRESIVDDFLSRNGLNRSNLVFSGGRHIQLYLPNTERIVSNINEYIKGLNSKLCEMFGTDLYVSYGCSEIDEVYDDEFSKKRNRYLKVFFDVSNERARMECQMYGPKEIEIINHQKFNQRETVKQVLDVLQEKSVIKESDLRKHGIILANCKVNNDRFDGVDREYGLAYIRKGKEYIEKNGTIPIWIQDNSYFSFDIGEKSANQYGIMRFDIDNFKELLFDDSNDGRIGTHLIN